jgi:omega-6 fatty acid desaturase (delta-12 desaturase)
VALSFGMFMVHVQHVRPYKGVYMAPKKDHNRLAAELMGSTYLSVPWWFSWATMGIEYHHIHHANARVPCYRLKVCGQPCSWFFTVSVHTYAVLSVWGPSLRKLLH